MVNFTISSAVVNAVERENFFNVFLKYIYPKSIKVGVSNHVWTKYETTYMTVAGHILNVVYLLGARSVNGTPNSSSS